MKIYSILILAFMLINQTFAQFFGAKYIDIEPATVIVTYSLNYQQDSTNPTKIRTSTLLLFIGDNVSKFKSKNNYIDDTIRRAFTSTEQYTEYEQNPKVQTSGILYEIYKNYPKGKMTYIDFIPSFAFRFEEDMNIFQWTLTGDTSIVCGYKAQKATCNFGGRSWIAWFSPSLPYSDGPYKFNGLPGLIVKVYDTRNHYIFEMISINKPAKRLMIDLEDQQYTLTTKQGFFQAQDSFRADIVNRAREAGGDNEMQQTAARNMAQRNNPIELKRK